MLASWDKSLQEFNQRVIFSHTRSVLSISTNEDTSAVVFSRKLDDGSDGHVISFLKWDKLQRKIDPVPLIRVKDKEPKTRTFVVGESSYFHKWTVAMAPS